MNAIIFTQSPAKVMQQAWAYYRAGEQRTRAFFVECLRRAWAWAKQTRTMYADSVTLRATVVAETDKAFQIQVTGMCQEGLGTRAEYAALADDQDEPIITETYWTPKSATTVKGESVTVAVWKFNEIRKNSRIQF